MDINQQDLIKFWTWTGFKENPDKSKLWNWDGNYKETNHWWIAPNYKNYKDLPQPTLDTLYAYAIPKLQDMGYNVVLEAKEHKEFQVTIINIFHIRNSTITNYISENPTEALYKAIVAVIENGR